MGRPKQIAPRNFQGKQQLFADGVDFCIKANLLDIFAPGLAKAPNEKDDPVWGLIEKGNQLPDAGADT